MNDVDYCPHGLTMGDMSIVFFWGGHFATIRLCVDEIGWRVQISFRNGWVDLTPRSEIDLKILVYLITMSSLNLYPQSERN